MLRAYSKRLLSPFTGQVQVVETDRARALTLDGKDWAVQYKYTSRPDALSEAQKMGRAFKFDHIRVANIGPGGIQRYRLPHFLDAATVNHHISMLDEYLSGIELPLPAADHHEYWLLDGDDGSPLALIYSCTEAEEMPLFPQKLEWTALSSAMMKIEPTDDELDVYVPPVNYRLEQLVNERAGKHPTARWVRRRETESETFPPLLVAEDWQQDEARVLYERYVERSASRLLMLHGLSQEVRGRLEIAARSQVFEVETYCHLYPEIADEKLMSAIRVEAQLRIAAGDT